MSRLAPLLFAALLPAAVAAPVPRDVRPGFGANGLLSRADLERVKFESRTLKDGEGGVRFNQPREDRDEKEVEKKADDRPRPKNRYDVAVHMPWTQFREGEPTPAYLVLRNNRGTTLGLGSRLDFSRPIPMFHGGDADFDLRNRATGESVLGGISASTNCGGGNLVEVPADGYYVVRADLSRVAGKPLPAGEYEVDWRYGRLASAPVRFAVVKPNPGDPKPTPAKHASSTFFQLQPEFEAGDHRSQNPGVSILWHETQLGHVHPAAFASALAVGPEGAYVPDVAMIPAADKFVVASVAWKPYRDGDRVAVTLGAAPPLKKVVFSEVPQLYLQLEVLGEAGPETLADESAKQGDRKSEELTTPLTIEARLPTDWRERVGVAGSARVAVVVTSKRLELPVGRAIERLQEARELKASGGRERPPVWAGVVRTDFAELRFPPAPPPLSVIQYAITEEPPAEVIPPR